MSRQRAAVYTRSWCWCPSCEQHVDTAVVHEHAEPVAVRPRAAAPAQLSLALGAIA